MNNTPLMIPALGLLLLSTNVFAQDGQEFVPDQTAEEVLDTGWDGFLSVGATINGISNQNVVGQTDGSVWNLGLQFDGMLEYLVGSHEWRTSMGYIAGVAQTTLIDQFVKSADHFQLESIYFYHLPNPSWLGPFARAQLDTSFFTGADVRPTEVDYRVNGSDTTETTDQYTLTAPFAPMIVRESVGFFAQPVTTDAFALDIRLGMGARQVTADGQFVVGSVTASGDRAADDAGPNDLIIIEPLKSYTQAGLENVIAATGVVEEGRVNYILSSELMIPFINDLAPNDDRSAMEIANWELMAGLSFKLVEWASLDYQFRAISEPGLNLPEPWQVSNNLLLTFTQVLVSEDAAE